MAVETQFILYTAPLGDLGSRDRGAGFLRCRVSAAIGILCTASYLALFSELSVSLRCESSGASLRGRGVQKLHREGPVPSSGDKMVTLIEIEL